MANDDISGERTVVDGSGQNERPLPGFSLESLVDETLDDRYTIDQLVGMGAMGAVYRARQTRLRRTVALKVPKPHLCLQPDFLRRFEREALTMAKIVHQNIVQIFDVCVSPDHTKPSFIAMEFVEGTEFDRFLSTQKENLTVSAVLDLFKQIAGGLDSAHQHGIVHRDIKPGNILITMPQRVAKIMDFGIARVEMEDTFQTTDGHGMVGTPAYMAPEQVSGGKITAATDIYALGMMFYRLLSGHAPWETRSTHELLLAKINSAPPPVSSRNGALPRTLDKVLERALAIEPEKRQQTAAQLVDEVSRALDPLKHLSFAEIFDQEATAIALQKLSPKTKAPSAGERVVPGLLLVCLLVALAAAAIALLPKETRPAKNRTAVVAAPTPDVAATPAPSPTPRPTFAPTPSPAPTPEPTPQPTPPPTPEPTPAPPAVVAEATPEPTPTPVAAAGIEPRWDPSLRPPTISSYRRQSLVEEYEEWLSANVRRPMYRSQFDERRNALAALGSAQAQALLRRFRDFRETNDEVALALTIREADCAVWEDRARIYLDARIVGRPKGHKQANYRATLWQSEAPLEARLQKADDGTISLVAFE